MGPKTGWSRVALCGILLAADTAVRAGQAPADASPGRRFVTRHAIEIGGRPVAYEAIVEESFAADAKGERAASLVSISYLRADVRDSAARPVIFAFNGGPGASSVWLHLGALGPRRVALQDGVSDEEIHPRTTPPFLLADNPDSPLDVADLVLFDPPGTGFSRLLNGADEREFYGVHQDARVTSEFIQGWLTRHNRWHSPRFLVGESYGAVRAAVTAKLLMGGPTSSGRMDGVTLNGVILLGPSLGRGEQAGDTGLVNALPALAATAWYHDKVPQEGRTLEQHVQDARAFAAGDLLRAYYLGSALPPEQRGRLAGRLAALIGLSPDIVLERNLRIDARTFASELLKQEGRELGLYDGRFTLPIAPRGRDPVADDPAMAQYVPAFVAAMNRYLSAELDARIGLPYNAIEFAKVNARWDYGGRDDFGADLAVAMRRSPGLRLFVGVGYFDLVTTFGSAEYTLSHAGIAPDRVTWRLYESGHMPYIGAGSRSRLARDLREFIAAASR